MKKSFIFSLFIFCFAVNVQAQDSAAVINSTWPVYATDTTLTFQQISTLCDSMFTIAGYTPGMEMKKDIDDEEGVDEGGSFVKYLRWKAFWCHRYDVATGKLHNIAADIADALKAQNKTTSSPVNCGGTSDLQNSLTSGPVGWQFIGPQRINNLGEGSYGNSLHQHLGEVNDIKVNPLDSAEIYIRDQWGGVWKTMNANVAPANTWTCLSDHLPSIAGIGVTDFHVEFSSSGPNRLFCVVGSPYQGSLPDITRSNPHTVGVFYSIDDGATFNQMDLSAFISDFSTTPVLSMSYWPGNSTSSRKYLFITTQFQIYRVDITDPASVLYDAVYDVHADIPNTAGERNERFRGFTSLAFDYADPSVMYVTTRSNWGYAYGNTAAVYKVIDCNSCIACSLIPIPTVANDILEERGSFAPLNFPRAYSGWFRSGWERTTIGGNPHLESIPYDTVSRVEMNVYGSYLHNIDYNITFKVTLPPYTEVDVVLKDVHPDNIYKTDWGTSIYGPPVFTGMRGYYDVGPGFSGSGGSPVAGHYKNDGGSTATFTINTVVSALDYVSRLEFGSYKLPGYFGGDIELDSISVVQEYDNSITALRTSPVTAGLLFYISGKLRKIRDSGGTFGITEYGTHADTSSQPHPGFFSFSSVNPNVIYFYRHQTSFGPRLEKFDFTNPTVYIDDPYTHIELHGDARCVLAMPDSTGTDDILYVGTDGGIALGTFFGHWKDLNGTGLRTSWANDIGSSIYTGQVGISTTDNGVMWSEVNDHLHWDQYSAGDGGQFKYGRSGISKGIVFHGFTGGGPGFTDLRILPNGLLPIVDSGWFHHINVLGLAKLANTNHGDFLGTAGVRCDVYKLKVSSGAGTTSNPYRVFFDSVTVGSGYSIRQPVQAIGADMNDPDYLVIYSHNAYWERGQFAYSTNASATIPTWTFKDNTAAEGGVDHGLTTLVVDPVYHASGKRLWAGASGYGTAGDKRVFQTVNGGSSWEDISYGLPSSPINALVYDEASHCLFAGTDQGVYAYNVDNGENGAANPWVCYSLHLPNMFVTGLDINRCTGKLYACSFGRGAYEAELPVATNEDTIATGATVVWSQERTQFKNVYIPSGASLLITGCTIYMGRNLGIRVAPGGKLTVDGATITNSCDGCMWNGISAVGNPSLAQSPATNQGWVVMRNNSEIAHARYGVTNCDFWGTPSSTTGGIIQVTSSKFYNCHNSVTMMAYNAPGTPVPPNLSYFNNCIFLNDNSYRGYSSHYYMKNQVDLRGVNGIKFAGCRFINRDDRLFEIGQGVGINSFNASFRVEPWCAGSIMYPGTCTDLRRSYFCGFEDGIVLKDVIGLGATVSIDQADFDSVSIGVLVYGQNNVATTRCNFTIGRGNNLDSNITTLGSCGNIGIVHQNSLFFKIEGNTFTGKLNYSSFSYSSWYNYGVVIANSGNFENTVFRNTFDSLTQGVRSIGNNRGSYSGLGSGMGGLQIICNTFSNNHTDIAITPDGTTGLSQGIGFETGMTNRPAKNTFSGSTVNISNTCPYVNYHYDSANATTERPSIVSANIWRLPTANGTSCVSTLPSTGGSAGAFVTTSLNVGRLEEYITSFDSHKVAYDSMSVAYVALFDLGGQSNFLANYMDTATTDSALYSLLVSGSPYLSDGVLLGLISSQSLSLDQVDSILTKNPEGLRHDEVYVPVVDYFQGLQRDDPYLPDYVRSITGAASSLMTARSVFEGSLSFERSILDDAVNAVLTAIKSPVDTNISVNDTTGEGICIDSNSVYYTLDSSSYYYWLDAVDPMLENYVPDAKTPYERMGYHYFRGNYKTAQDIFSEIDSTLLPEEELPSYRSYAKLWPAIYAATDDDRLIYNLNEDEIALVDTFSALEFNYNRGRQLIWNLSASIKDFSKEVDFSAASATSSGADYHAPLFTCVLTLLSDARPGSGGDSNSTHPVRNFKKKKGPAIKAYPNPSSGAVIFEYNVPSSQSNDVITITVLDVLGEKIAELQGIGNSGKILWDTGRLPGGLYLFHAANSKGLIGNGKVVLIR